MTTQARRTVGSALTGWFLAMAACGGGGGGGGATPDAAPDPDGGGTAAAFFLRVADNPSLAADAVGTLDPASGTITVPVPFGTDVRALVATYTLEGGLLQVGSAAQTSGVTPNDFTLPVDYTQHGAAGSAATYTVAVVTGYGALVDFASDSGAAAVAVADFNADGKPDLAVANYNAGTVTLLLGETAAGASAPSFVPAVRFATAVAPYAIVVADFNGDGSPDVAVVSQTTGTISVLLNTTPQGATVPTLAARVDLAGAANPYGLAAGDVTGDGAPDLVSAGTPALGVFVNTTAHGAAVATFAARADFTPTRLDTSSGVTVAAGSVGGTAAVDLVYSTARGDVQVVLDPIVSPTAVTTDSELLLQAGAPTAIAIGDVDGIAGAEIAVGYQIVDRVCVFVGLSMFPTCAKTATTPVAIAIGDLDGDHHPDLAVASFSPTVTLARNTTSAGGALTLSPSTAAYRAGGRLVGVATVDLDRDGKLDLVVADAAHGTVSVALAR